MTYRSFLGLLGCLLPVYLALAVLVPPADDELYYWCWATSLQWSYYDHPPMTAVMIRASTALFGNELWAVRLPAVCSTLGVLAVIGWLTRPRDLLPLVLFTPAFTAGAVVVTPDTPLLLFWSLYLLWLVDVQTRLADDRPVPAWLWAAGGVAVGCGVLGKYTTGLAVGGGFVCFCLGGQWRRWVGGYVAHGLIACVVASPILIHNVNHDFKPLLYQWTHAMNSPRPGVGPFAEFVAIQVVLFGLLPFGVFAWAVARRRELVATPRLRACWCLFVLPFAFFLYKAARGPLEGNWALACYIGVWPLAAEWYERAKGRAVWRRLTPAAFAVPAGAVVVLLVHLAWPLDFLPPAKDRITRQTGKSEVAQKLADALPGYGPPAAVFVPSYQWTALLRFHGIDARQIDGFTRPSHFTQTPEKPADRDRVYVFAEGFLPPEYTAGFGPARIVDRFPLMVRRQEVTVFWLLEYSRSGGPTATGTAAATGRPLDRGQ